jgi:hypothetical protein
MWPATGWDDAEWDGANARGWTVMNRLRARQRREVALTQAARRRGRDSSSHMRMMTAAMGVESWNDSLRARWRGGPTVVALLFAHPDSQPIADLDARGIYFDCRTGAVWDLFFPGYFTSPQGPEFEARAGSTPVGPQFASDWHFSPSGFDELRRHVEQHSGGRWRYSGESDLVLLNAWVPDTGDPTVDWESTQAWTVDRYGVTLPKAIEAISTDLETGAGDASYGVAQLVGAEASGRRESTTARDLTVQTLAGIAAALGAKAVGG